MCIRIYELHSCTHIGRYIGRKSCKSDQNTQDLLAQGVGTGDIRIGLNADKCHRNTKVECEKVEEKCEKCRVEEEELGRIALSYVDKGRMI
jgi:hypothetical protein